VICCTNCQTLCFFYIVFSCFLLIYGSGFCTPFHRIHAVLKNSYQSPIEIVFHVISKIYEKTALVKNTLCGFKYVNIITVIVNDCESNPYDLICTSQAVLQTVLGISENSVDSWSLAMYGWIPIYSSFWFKIITVPTQSNWIHALQFIIILSDWKSFVQYMTLSSKVYSSY
jgi:hypothetical protein